MRRLPLALAAFASLTLALPSAFPPAPIIIWNATASSPIGLYRVISGEPRRGSMAVIRLPDPLRRLAHDRAYLPATTLLIKPIVALRGDLVCRWGNAVSINGRIAAFARNLDRAARPLPHWHGCRRLQAMLLILGGQPDSFDSRYFGPIDRAHLIGLAVPLIVLQP